MQRAFDPPTNSAFSSTDACVSQYNHYCTFLIYERKRDKNSGPQLRVVRRRTGICFNELRERDAGFLRIMFLEMILTKYKTIYLRYFRTHTA